MPIYFGKSRDASDMKEVRGMYLHPDCESWSNIPFTKEQRNYDKVYTYMNDNRLCLDDVKKQIEEGKCRLAKGVRKYVLNHYNEDGSFKNQD